MRASGDPASSLLVKTTLVGFDAGNLISDEVFTSRNTMSEGQVQSFLNSKATCRSGATCLTNLRIATTAKPADKYCAGYAPASNESAAAIIVKVAQSCGINPQVLIVMLQKEQGLVTHTYPSAARMAIAMGFNCPDTAPCSPGTAGFFTQVYGAARQMQIYMEGRHFTWYAPGKTWNIRYSPNASCGSSPVYIANKATSAMYYYTPYQPNAAALAAGHGEAHCGAYGNRNFYNYFTDWFGSTKSSGARIMKDASTGTTYLVANAVKYAFPSPERAVQFTWITPTQTVSSSELASFTDGGIAPRAVRTDQGRVYLLDSGRRFQLPSCSLAADFGWNCATLPMVAQGQANAYPDAGVLTPSVSGLGATWLVQGSSRREILDTSILAQYGISTAVSAVADALVGEYTLGDPVLGAGVYADSGGAMKAILQGGATYDVSTPAQVDAVRGAARRITPESMKRLAAVADLPLSVMVDGRTHVLSNDGWMLVDAYGSAVAFTGLGAGALSGMPHAAAATGPHFVRERSDLQVYLVSGGALQAVTAEEQRWISGRYGVPSSVRVLADTTLGGSSQPVAGLVKTADGAAYLIDGINRYRFRDCAQVADWGGACAQLAVATASQLSQVTDRGWLAHLARNSDGTMWLVQAGARREVVDPAVLAPYGIGSATSAISKSLLEKFPVGPAVLGSGAYSDGSAGLLVVNTAGVFSVGDGERFTVVSSGVKRLSLASFGLLAPQAVLPARMFSDNRALILTELGWLQVDPAQYGGAQLFTEVASGGSMGITQAGNESRPHFVRERTSGQLFLVSGGVVQPVANESAKSWIIARFGVPSQTWSVPASVLNGLSLPPGLVFKDAAGAALLSGGTSFYRLSGCAAAGAYGGSCNNAPIVTPSVLGMVDGGALAALLRGAGGDLWLVQDAVRREVPDPSVLAAYGIGSQSTAVPTALLNAFRVGDPVVVAGPYRDGSGAMRIVTSGGRVLDVPSSLRVEILTARARVLSDASFALLRSTGTLPVRTLSSGNYYLLSVQGWVQVDSANFAPLVFPATTSDVITAVPAAGTALGPRFVREAGGAQVYLASGGLVPVNAQEQAAITATYGVPSAVLVLADGALR